MANAINRKWQDAIALLLGIWLFFSPWILGFYAAIPGASWNFFVIGVAFIVFAAFGLKLAATWEEWVNLVLGAWLLVSPWVLRYSDNITARDDAVVVGLIVAAMAIWVLTARRTRIGSVDDHPLPH
jgi:SPW repeat-containing protein